MTLSTSFLCRLALAHLGARWHIFLTLFAYLRQIRSCVSVGASGGLHRDVCNTFPLETALSLVKAFCGIAVAMRLLKVDYTYRPTPPKVKFLIHRRTDDKWTPEDERDLDYVTSETFLNLVANDLEGRLRDEVMMLSWMRRVLQLMRYVFSHQDKSDKIIASGRWLFDSYCGSNQLLSFVRARILWRYCWEIRPYQIWSALGNC